MYRYKADKCHALYLGVSFHLELAEKHIEKGYWYYRPTENFPPPAKLLSEYKGEERLWLIISHGNEADNVIRKRERTYPPEIPERLATVKTLWANHINQETFDAITQLKGITSLNINSNRIKDLASLSNLVNLEHLGLLNMTKVESIEALSSLTQLRTLKLEHFKKISRFDVISNLQKLEGLQIDGDMYTAQKIEDFDFISDLTNLRYVTLTNTRANNKSMDSFTGLQKLEMFQCSTNYPNSEFQKLAELPKLKHIGGNLDGLIKTKS